MSTTFIGCVSRACTKPPCLADGVVRPRKPISLISHSDVRYRGILAGIDPNASTIQLSNGMPPSPAFHNMRLTCLVVV